MGIKVLSYMKSGDLANLLRRFDTRNPNLRFIIASRRDRANFFRLIGRNSYTPFDSERIYLWTWQDIYEDVCRVLRIKRRRVLSPPDHLLILRFILSKVLAEKPDKALKFPGLLRAGFPRILSQDIGELVNENVSPELLHSCDDDTSTPAEFLLPEVYRQYLDYLRNNDLMDNAQTWNCTNEILSDDSGNYALWGRNLELVFVGFLSFTHGQFELLNTLAKICEQITILKPEASLKNFHDASVQFQFGNSHDSGLISTGKILEMPVAEPGLEPEVIARNLALWSQNKGEFARELAFESYEDVGIMLEAGRENFMTHALERYKIPYNLENGVEINLTLPGRVLSSIRALRTQRFPAYDTAMLLTQACFAGRKFDATRAFKSGATGLKNWREYLQAQIDSHESPEIFERALLTIDSIEDFCAKLSRKNTPAEIMRAFYEFLTVPNLWLDAIAANSEISRELDESIRITASAIQTVGEKVLALDELLPDLGRVKDETLQDDDAFEFLENWCRNTRTRPAIQISDSVRIFTSTPPVLSSFRLWIMLGVTQETWSESVTNSPLLGQKERETLISEGSYLPTNQDKAMQREALFRRLLHTGENLTLISRAELDDEDRPIDNTPFLLRFVDEMRNWNVRKIPASGINILLNGDGYVFPEIDECENHERTRPEIHAKYMTIGASELKKFLSCPYNWWLGKRAEIYTKDSELARDLDWGNLAHLLWEKIWRRFASENILADGEFFRRILAEEWEIMLKSEGDYEKFSWLVRDFRLARALEGFRFRIMRLGRLQADILDALHDGGYYHKRILLEENARLSTRVDGILCSGQCDRIEILSDTSGAEYVIISDYKEGKSSSYEKSFTKIDRYDWNFDKRKAFRYGLQISAYAAMFSGNSGAQNLSGICFLGHNDGEISGTFDERFRGIYSQFGTNKGSIDERIDEGDYAMKCAARIFSSGILPTNYRANDCKTYCKMKSICRRGEFYGEDLQKEFGAKNLAADSDYDPDDDSGEYDE